MSNFDTVIWGGCIQRDCDLYDARFAHRATATGRVECASASPLTKVCAALLSARIDVMALSLGAFADPATEKLLNNAARNGPGRLEIPRELWDRLASSHNMTVFGGIMGFESFVEVAGGWVAVASNCACIFELVADEGQMLEARKLYHEWVGLIRAVGGQKYVAGTKALLTHIGFQARKPRAPRLPSSPEDDATMRQMVEKHGMKFVL